MNITLIVPDKLVPLIEARARIMKMSRHKAILSVLDDWCGDPEPILALRPENWPIVEHKEVCAGCKNGEHCANTARFEEIDEAHKQRIVWVCRCPDCIPERKAVPVMNSP